MEKRAPPDGSEERISRVVEIFGQLDLSWALVGAHALGLFTEPRATVDFDFIVEEKQLKSLLQALEHEFGPLETMDLGPALRLQALDIDLIRSNTHPLFGEALRRTQLFSGWPVPVPEMLIVLKFLSATSPWRGRTKQTYDVADLAALVEAVGRENLDEPLIQEMAAHVYPGAEAELSTLLDRIERGEPLVI